MSAEQTTSLMQRKARGGREAYAARAMSLARALRLTAAKQADHLMSLALGVLSVTRKTVEAKDLAQCLEAPWLTMLMDGPEHQVAAVMIDPVLSAGLIQQQTMGKVTSAPEGAAALRRHTATDAALCAPFIEALLSGAAALPEEAEDRDLLVGYRFGVLAQEPRHAQLALDGPRYELIEMTLDLAAGTRTGKLWLILPEPTKAIGPPSEDMDRPELPPNDPNLSSNVMGLKAELTIALTRLKLPLQDITAFTAGDILPLNLSSMTQALVLDSTGTALSRGTLGQIDGMRALQVEQQRAKQQVEPRRRMSDRADLDLPDVTAPHVPKQGSGVGADGTAPEVNLPTVSDVGIFGDIDDLPELPDVEVAAQAADNQAARADRRSGADEASAAEAAVQKNAGW